MSVIDVIKRYETEKEDIRKKRKALDEREAFLELLLRELRGAARRGPRRKGRKKKVAKKRGGRRRKGLTVRDAIIQAVSSAKSPIAAGQIIKKAVRLSGGAEASIRTQINALTKDGSLKQVPYSGRGFQYKIAGRKPAKKVMKKAKKKAKKKVKRVKRKVVKKVAVKKPEEPKPVGVS